MIKAQITIERIIAVLMNLNHTSQTLLDCLRTIFRAVWFNTRLAPDQKKEFVSLLPAQKTQVKAKPGLGEDEN